VHPGPPADIHKRECHAGGDNSVIARELAHGYCFLDRALFCYLKMNDPALLKRALAAVEERVKDGNGRTNLERLCEEGCEREELVWLSLGCWDRVRVLTTEQLFGRNIDQVNKNLELIRNCANVTASWRQSVFGALFRSVPGTLQLLPEHLRNLAELAEAAKRDFKNAQWFLSLAKIRITDHVTYKARDGEPHDADVSGLIAAVSGSDYNADAHRRFRTNARYRKLLSHKDHDPSGYHSLDPYTVRTDSKRMETISVLQEGMKDPAFRQAIEGSALSFLKLAERLASIPRTGKRH